jgi:hypothetical protein
MSDQHPPEGPQQPSQPPAYGQQPPPAYGQQPYGQQPSQEQPPYDQQPFQPYPEDSARREYEQYAATMTVERPQSVTNAVLLMRIGAALGALYVLITLAMLGSLKDDIRDELNRQGETYTQSDIDAAYTVVIVSVVVLGVLGVILWLWMAAMNKKGKNWARITATVFAGINILFSLLSLVGSGTSNPSVIGVLYTIANLIIAVVALYFMYRKESSAYYAAMSRR